MAPPKRVRGFFLFSVMVSLKSADRAAVNLLAKKTIADVLQGNSSSGVSVESLPEFGNVKTHRDESAFVISCQEMFESAQPFFGTLVGRFAYNRP